jgi:hypothetical protein
MKKSRIKINILCNIKLKHFLTLAEQKKLVNNINRKFFFHLL